MDTALRLFCAESVIVARKSKQAATILRIRNGDLLSSGLRTLPLHRPPRCLPRCCFPRQSLTGGQNSMPGCVLCVTTRFENNAHAAQPAPASRARPKCYLAAKLPVKAPLVAFPSTVLLLRVKRL